MGCFVLRLFQFDAHPCFGVVRRGGESVFDRSAANCRIEPQRVANRRAGKGESYHITVGSGVWIGGRSTLLLNTSIGDGSMIAACACVSTDVPADTLVAGVPAKVVKEFEDFAAVAQKE